MSPETDAALKAFLDALTDLVKLATEALKRDLAGEQKSEKRQK